MYGMPFAQALVFAGMLVVLAIATQAWRFHPFLVLLVIAAVFGFSAGYPTSQLGSAFGSGFSEKLYAPGLVIVAAAVVSGLAENAGASAGLAAPFARRRWARSGWLAGCVGLVTGLCSSPSAALALLTPLFRPDADPARHRTVIALALSMSASHGLLLFTPVPIAAAAILGAQWSRVALFGVPLALLLAAVAVVFAHWSLRADREQTPALVEEEHRCGFSAALPIAVAVPVLLLMVQSLGDIPSEPLGGGPKREFILGVGRPLILFLVSLAIMLAARPRQSLKLLADSSWTGRVFGNVAGILLIVGAAGGLQRLCQQTGMAEMIAERVTGWQAGVLVPFATAAVVKTLQGSSLVAAITAAGMAQPLLASLGLGSANGTALAALAVGAGAMTVSHINDDYFWLAVDRAGLSPLRGLATLSLGTLLQGLLAALILLILSMLLSH